MILAGNLSVAEGLGLLALFTAALFPVFLILLRRHDAAAFERHVRARGARPASERRLDQLGQAIDVDPDLERYYGTVDPLDDADHRP